MDKKRGYHHGNLRSALVEAARQGYEIFADLMEYAYQSGQPSALAAFEATGRAYLAFARRYPGHYIAMFESGISVNRTPELAAVAEVLGTFSVVVLVILMRPISH
jgi:hypothetical protein